MQHQYLNGISSVYDTRHDLPGFIDDIRAAHGKQASGLVLVFYCPIKYPGNELVARLEQALPGVDCCGCSSSGEVTPEGLESGSAVAVLFPADKFVATACMLHSVKHLGLNEIVHEVANLKSELKRKLPQAGLQQAQATAREIRQGTRTSFGNTDSIFAISLIDGLSYSEESITSALKIGLGDIPLIGGSAGDSLQFNATEQFCNGTIFSNSAVLILIKSTLEFETFTNRNFLPTECKFVVTESDPDSRTVFEFNAEPAALAYAQALQLSPEELTSEVFASNPVVLRVGGEFYCRSIQKVNEDASLTFFCAIDNGIVLTLAKSSGMVASTRDMLTRLDEKLDGIDMILGFDCVLRRLDAANRGVNDSISLLYREYNVAGFGTYGEQYDSMHLNQTFTGVAFSARSNDPTTPFLNGKSREYD